MIPNPDTVRTAAWVGSVEVAVTVSVERRSENVAGGMVTGSPAGVPLAGDRGVGAGLLPMHTAAGGRGSPGQGDGWPTTGPSPPRGPEPWARKGKSCRFSGIAGEPRTKFSAKIHSSTGKRYWPASRSLAPRLTT